MPTLKYWDGAAWQNLLGAASTIVYPGTELDYKQITANVAVSGTTEATANTIITSNSVACDGSRVRVEAWVPGMVAGGGVAATFVLLRDTTVIGQSLLGGPGSASGNLNTEAKTLIFYDAPSVGSHTYTLKAFASGATTIQAGAGGSGQPLPAFLRVSSNTVATQSGGSSPPTAVTYRKATTKTVNTSTAETDLLNGEIAIGAGVMGTSGIARLTAWGDMANTSGSTADTPRWKLKLGSTTLIDSNVLAGFFGSGAPIRSFWRLTAEIQNRGAANSQYVSFWMEGLFYAGSSGSALFTIGTGAVQIPVVGPSNYSPFQVRGWNNSAVDTSIAQALAFTTQMSLSNINHEVRLQGALVEII
jgi:hypothetical protein